MISGVYVILGPTGYYIGSALNVARRWAAHRYELRRGKHTGKRLQNAWNAHGENAFVFMLVEETSNVLEAEQRWLDAAFDLRAPVYNCCRDARAPMSGRTQSLEARAKLSKAGKGRKKPAGFGQKIAEANRRRVWTQESRAKQSAVQKARFQ